VEAAIQLRTRTYLTLLGVVSALAVVTAFATLGFLELYNVLQELLWDDLPEALGVEPRSWYTLAVTTLGGAVVGLLLVVVPGHGGPMPAAGHGVGDQPVSMRDTFGLLLVSLVSLAVGASLGPEAALLAFAIALGGKVAERARRAELGRVLGMSNAGSLLSGLFGSPLAPAVMALEVTKITGHNLYVFLIPVLVASVAGLLTFEATYGGPLLDIDLPAYPAIEVLHVLEAIVIAGAAAAVGLATIAAFRVAERAFRPLETRLVLRAALGGLGIGLVALVAGEETLFSGEHELTVLLDDPEAYGAGALLLILGGKIVAFALSLATGFRGGRIFPVLFIGAVVGFIAADVFDRIPLAVAVACGMAGAGVALIRLPIFVALLITFFAAPATVPLIVLAVVVGYLLTFDRRELSGAHDEEQEVATREDLGAAATSRR
jgi:H+/Cl- antiporter ClcA